MILLDKLCSAQLNENVELKYLFVHARKKLGTRLLQSSQCSEIFRKQSLIEN